MPRKQIDRQTAARVPDAEQPYPVPDNWAWVELQTCFAIVSEKIDPQIDHVLPYVGLEHIKKGAGLLALGQSDEVKSTKTAFKKNDVLYGKLRPYLDKHFVADIDGICSTDILVLRANQHSSAPFLNYYFSVPCVIQYAIEHSHGIHLPRVSPKDIGKMPLPLPPLAEQRRIVAKLDALLGKLRAARDLLDAARDSFALRRAAILHKAFSGQLTAAWRKEHPDLARPEFEECQEQRYSIPENWVWVTMGDISKIIGGGTPSTLVDEYYEHGEIPWITPADLSNYQSIFIQRGRRNITQTGLEHSSAQLIKKGAILLSSRAPIGYVAIAENELCTNQGFKSFEPSSALDSIYGYWYLKSSTALLESMGSGTTFNEISKKKVAKIPLPLAPIEEQREIVRRLDALLTHEAEAAALLDMDERLDLLEQSILARAFRGELGTRDPADAPALRA